MHGEYKFLRRQPPISIEVGESPDRGQDLLWEAGSHQNIPSLDSGQEAGLGTVILIEHLSVLEARGIRNRPFHQRRGSA